MDANATLGWVLSRPGVFADALASWLSARDLVALAATCRLCRALVLQDWLADQLTARALHAIVANLGWPRTERRTGPFAFGTVRERPLAWAPTGLYRIMGARAGRLALLPVVATCAPSDNAANEDADALVWDYEYLYRIYTSLDAAVTGSLERLGLARWRKRRFTTAFPVV
jgi:hypothetical protein